jgi:hypothetical protein
MAAIFRDQRAARAAFSPIVVPFQPVALRTVRQVDNLETIRLGPVDDLNVQTLDCRESGSKRLMTPHDLGNTILQRGSIERPLHPLGQWDVPTRAQIRVPMGLQQPLLRARQRRRGRARAGAVGRFTHGPGASTERMMRITDQYPSLTEGGSAEYREQTLEADDYRSMPWMVRFADEPLRARPRPPVPRPRDERGLSPEDVAIQLGLPVNHVEEHERGARRFEREEQAGECAALRCPRLGVRISRFFRSTSRANTGHIIAATVRTRQRARRKSRGSRRWRERRHSKVVFREEWRP